MTNTKEKRRGTCCMFSRHFRKHSVVSLATHTNLQERWYCRPQGNGTVQEETPHKCYHAKLYNLTQRAVGIAVNKLKARFLPTELMYILSILSTWRDKVASWSIWRTMIRKRRKPKRKVFGSNGSANLLHSEQHTWWEPMERSLSCWNPFPMNSWHNKCRKIKDLKTIKKKLMRCQFWD